MASSASRLAGWSSTIRTFTFRSACALALPGEGSTSGPRRLAGSLVDSFIPVELVVAPLMGRVFDRLTFADGQETEHGQAFVQEPMHLIGEGLVKINHHVPTKDDVELIE